MDAKDKEKKTRKNKKHVKSMPLAANWFLNTYDTDFMHRYSGFVFADILWIFRFVPS